VWWAAGFTRIWGAEAVPIFCALAVSVWLLVAWGMPSPRQGVPHMIRVGDRAADPELRDQLLALPGVEEALIVAEEGVAYLKVDKRQVDWARLQEFAVEG
jgi:hypothetical protein